MDYPHSKLAIPIYRFKFSSQFQKQLVAFSDIHRYDEVPTFIESWKRWCSSNSNIINEEQIRLKQLGCTKDIQNKMYKSVRYYFKNKSSEDKEQVKRRKYISLSSDLLEDMSRHIQKVAFKECYKPQYAYNNFISNDLYNTHLNNETNKLIELGMNECDIENKIKKTYKNRYFLKQKE